MTAFSLELEYDLEEEHEDIIEEKDSSLRFIDFDDMMSEFALK